MCSPKGGRIEDSPDKGAGGGVRYVESAGRPVLEVGDTDEEEKGKKMDWMIDIVEGRREVTYRRSYYVVHCMIS